MLERILSDCSAMCISLVSEGSRYGSRNEKTGEHQGRTICHAQTQCGLLWEKQIPTLTNTQTRDAVPMKHSLVAADIYRLHPCNAIEQSFSNAETSWPQSRRMHRNGRSIGCVEVVGAIVTKGRHRSGRPRNRATRTVRYDAH